MSAKLPITIEDLQARFSAGEQFRFLYFWGHRSKTDGSVGKACLSQWRPAVFKIDGVSYATAEHYMMAEKARLFGDQEMLAKILDSPEPKSAKALGRKVRGFDPAVWEQHRFSIVARGSRAKFEQNPRLKEFLDGTKGQILVEASPYDKIWGIGLKEQQVECQDPSQWKGLNLLGFALTAVRDGQD